jgi:hypothetical protein
MLDFRPTLGNLVSAAKIPKKSVKIYLTVLFNRRFIAVEHTCYIRLLYLCKIVRIYWVLEYTVQQDIRGQLWLLVAQAIC